MLARPPLALLHPEAQAGAAGELALRKVWYGIVVVAAVVAAIVAAAVVTGTGAVLCSEMQHTTELDTVHYITLHCMAVLYLSTLRCPIQ